MTAWLLPGLVRRMWKPHAGSWIARHRVPASQIHRIARPGQASHDGASVSGIADDSAEQHVDLTQFIGAGADGILQEDGGDEGGVEPWEAMVDRIQFRGGVPEVNFRGPSEVVSAYEASSGFEEIEASELTAACAQSGAELWDVRPAEEFATGHVPDARNVPLEALEAAIAIRGESAFGPLFVISTSGARSAQAQVRLTKVYQLEGVRNVRGGVAAWEAQGGRLEIGTGS